MGGPTKKEIDQANEFTTEVTMAVIGIIQKQSSGVKAVVVGTAMSRHDKFDKLCKRIYGGADGGGYQDLMVLVGLGLNASDTFGRMVDAEVDL